MARGPADARAAARAGPGGPELACCLAGHRVAAAAARRSCVTMPTPTPWPRSEMQVFKPPNARDKVRLLRLLPPRAARALASAHAAPADRPKLAAALTGLLHPTASPLPTSDLVRRATLRPQVKRAFSFKRKQPKPPPSNSPASSRPLASTPAKSYAAHSVSLPVLPKGLATSELWAEQALRERACARARRAAPGLA